MDTNPSRRRLIKTAAGGALAITAVGAVTRIAGHNGPGPSGAGRGVPALQLSSQGLGDVEALDVRLGNRYLPSVSAHRWQSQELPTSTHSMVAFTWGAVTPTPPRIRIKSRADGRWTAWTRVPLLHDLPDEGSAEGVGQTRGTDLVWIGASDGIQIEVGEARPEDLTLVLLHPSRTLGDTAVRAAAPRRSTASTDPQVPRPEILTRADWAADDRWRNGGPWYNDTIQQAHVHHTANSNTYSRAEVPGLIRGMYRYHTHNLGWSDIAYNFLVDRFGRVWEGRAGGMNRPVRGAHTLGFNATSTGISVIGNFDLVAPTKETLTAVAAVAAWKLDLYDRDPTADVRVTSEGSDKFAPGKVVRLPVIDGHRDTNDTACPGQHLYASLPTIRRRASDLITKAHSTPTKITVTDPATISGIPTLGETLTINSGAFDPPDAESRYTWQRDGVTITGATASTYQCTLDDVAHTLTARLRLVKKGLDPVTEELATAGPVTARPQVAVRTNSWPGRAIVHVHVSAPDGLARTPTGQIVVRVKNRLRTITLVDGRGVARFGRKVEMAPGTYAVAVQYSGDQVFTAASAETTVNVS